MRNVAYAGVALLLSGCATASDVMDMGNGVYMVTAYAAPARGGAAGATQVAFSDAQAFCATKGGKPIVVGNDDRDVPQAAFGPSGGGLFAAGNTTLRFRCQ